MRLDVLRRHSYWLLPLLAATLVALLGAQLIRLSVHERSEQLRQSAQSAVLRHASLIEAELATLAAAAQREAGSAGAGASESATPGHGTFWMSAEGAVLRSSPGDAAIASAVAREWVASDATRRAAVLFGPVRYGSQWIVAARVARADGNSPATPAWSVSYEDLEPLLARARFGALVNEGYDFQLSQSDALTQHPRVFLSSQPGTLAQPATGTIRQ
ncbi:MAG TPA: hypothetical protein VI195_04470, partial [Steroidobacteraceae bacterium]